MSLRQIQLITGIYWITIKAQWILADFQSTVKLVCIGQPMGRILHYSNCSMT